MKNNDLYVSRKIIQKSNSYLKIAIGMFLAVSIFIVTAGVVYIEQYYGLNKNFFDNKAVHTINVSAYSDEGGITALQNEDLERISGILSEDFPNEVFQVIPVYATCTGIIDEDGNMYKLYGIPLEGFGIVGEMEAKEDTIYFTEFEEAAKTFEIFSYEVTDDGGMVSKESNQVEFHCEKGVSTTSPILIFNGIQSENLFHGFVENNTFLNIAQQITGLESNNMDDLCGSGLIEVFGIFIDVENLAVVEDFSKVLGENGYSSMCTFDAFEGFGDYFEGTMWIVSVFAVFILLISVFLLLFAFNSYYKMQQKDMGILKYYGFSEKRILNIYINGLRTFFLLDGIVLAVYAIILSLVFGIVSRWAVVGFLVIAVWGILCIIYVVLKYCVIKGYIKRDILFLLKKSKEIE